MITLEGQRILITGAARGIGAATARILLSAGAHLAAHWHSDEGEIAALRAEFGADRVHALRADLGRTSETRALWAAARERLGAIDGLVNNAALMPYSAPEDPEDLWDRDWEQALAVNVRAVADLCREAIRDMTARGSGRIVTIASRAAFRGDLPDAMHYAASKGAVVALMRSIAKGYARKGLRAFLVAPGWVRTERVADRLDAPGNAHMLAEIPMGDAAPPQEVGNIVAFLLSGLADHATGATFDINGASYFH